MSPEQVRGLQADHRSDIFAFGAVLYEMLAGQRAFRGDTTVDTMSAILKEDPPGFPAAERQIPPALERVVDRCLEKNTARRFQSTHDLAFALEGLSAQSGAAPAAVGASTRRAAHLTGERVAWLAALIATGLVTGALVFFVTQPRVEPAAAVRFEVLPPPETTVDAGPAAPQPALSPDGRRLAFQVVNAEDQTVLAVRSFDTRESQVLPGTEGALLPFWSPDNRFIGFFAQGKLKKIDVTGGPPQVVCDAEVGEGGTWNRDGTIVFAPNMGTGLVRVSAAGGTPVPVTMLDEAKQELSHYHPWFLPDGRHFLFVARGPGNPPAQTIYAGSLDSLERTELVATNSKALYADGHLLFVREGTLLAQPFDSISLKVTGESFPATEDVGFNVIQARAAVSASATGTIAYRAAAAGELSQLVWFDRTGRQVATVGDPVDQMNVELSPDDTRVAVSVLDLATITRDLAIYDLARGGFRTRFTFDPEDEYFGIWSPDGSQVAFSSLRKGRIHTYQKAASGGVAENVVLADARENTYPSSWSADGRFIFYHTGNAKSPTLSDIWALPLAGGRKPVSVVQTALSEGGAQISPDGRWVAYRSNVSGGRTEVFVVPFRVPGQLSSTAASPRSTRQVSTAGGTNPRWRGDGQELFYLSSDNRLMAASVNGEGVAFEVGAVRPLFEVHPRTAEHRGQGPGSNYDVSADGQRFLVNTVAEQAAQAPITVVMNWTSALKK
jgi:Tol biopolymer transport system component